MVAMWAIVTAIMAEYIFLVLGLVMALFGKIRAKNKPKLDKKELSKLDPVLYKPASNKTKASTSTSKVHLKSGKNGSRVSGKISFNKILPLGKGKKTVKLVHSNRKGNSVVKQTGKPKTWFNPYLVKNPVKISKLNRSSSKISTHSTNESNK